MDLRVFGTVHLIYLAITVPLSVIGLLLAKKFAKTEKAQSIVLKSLGGLLLIWITINRLSQVTDIPMFAGNRSYPTASAE